MITLKPSCLILAKFLSAEDFSICLSLLVQKQRTRRRKKRKKKRRQVIKGSSKLTMQWMSLRRINLKFIALGRG
jgi:hypothetical protein